MSFAGQHDQMEKLLVSWGDSIPPSVSSEAEAVTHNTGKLVLSGRFPISIACCFLDSGND